MNFQNQQQGSIEKTSLVQNNSLAAYSFGI